MTDQYWIAVVTKDSRGFEGPYSDEEAHLRMEELTPLYPATRAVIIGQP